MARHDALLRIYKRLASRREALRKVLSLDSDSERTDGGDLGDVAAGSECREMNSQLASIESRELRNVERALQMIKDGEYGQCENCSQPIPVARLNALPFTVKCVNCQRSDEEVADDANADVDWDKACDYEIRFSEQEYSLKDFDLER